MAYSQEIEYDNSFEAGTNFTLRGNTNVFNHFYEYVKIFGRSPLHHTNLRLNRVDTKLTMDRFLEKIQVAFPDNKVERRYIYEVSLSNEVEDEATLDSNATTHILTLIGGTASSLHFYISYGCYFSVDVFAGSDEEFKLFSRIIKECALDYRTVNDVKPNKFYMITHDGHSLDLLEYKINNAKFSDFDLDRQYNDDFKEVSEHIETSLSKKDSSTGIVLLHGCPGSGKTTYLRYLISTIPKRIIYMPPDMANQLGTPAFFNFIRQYPDSILIIEDAENILRKRMDGDGTAPAISNLLNLSDGIMGDALNIQVLCTFNADIAEIDGALLRPGRLIANHYFGPLCKTKTEALVKHLYGEDVEPKSDEMTIAEIYTMNETYASSDAKRPTRRIGFLP